jgi:hypothetical protein
MNEIPAIIKAITTLEGSDNTKRIENATIIDVIIPEKLVHENTDRIVTPFQQFVCDFY